MESFYVDIFISKLLHITNKISAFIFIWEQFVDVDLDIEICLIVICQYLQIDECSRTLLVGHSFVDMCWQLMLKGSIWFIVK